MKVQVAFIVALFVASSSLVFCSELLDKRLDLIIDTFEIVKKNCSDLQVKNTNKEKISAGELLFESKVLSGDSDISCRTCHLDKFKSTDGLPLAIGVGGDGEGEYRLKHGDGVLVQRNAMSLVGRGAKHFTSFFWDGRMTE